MRALDTLTNRKYYQELKRSLVTQFSCDSKYRILKLGFTISSRTEACKSYAMQSWKKELEFKTVLVDCRIRQIVAMEGNQYLHYMPNHSSLGKKYKITFPFCATGMLVC